MLVKFCYDEKRGKNIKNNIKNKIERKRWELACSVVTPASGQASYMS